ncbi:MAG: pyridoxal-phosphate dependent enzyme, partial [Chlorobi bacterium]|nr:pyridoxal-phosphate dependent enzyme [Chlorobiota bacterium]
IEVDAAIPPEREDSYNNLAKNLALADNSLYYVDQHNNLDNNESYYMSLGPEIWEQTNGNIDYLIAGVGTGGSLFGTGKYLKEKSTNIKIIGIDPVGSVFYDFYKSGKLIEPSRYLLEGMGDEFLIKTATLNLMDDMFQVTDKKAFGWTKKLASEEGIIAGGSSGANVWGAVKLAKEIDDEAVIVTLLPDSGYKYFSTIYNEEWLKDKM